MAYIIKWDEFVKVLTRRRDDPDQSRVPLYYFITETQIIIYYTFLGQELKTLVDIESVTQEDIDRFKETYLQENAFEIVVNQDELIGLDKGNNQNN